MSIQDWTSRAEKDPSLRIRQTHMVVDKGGLPSNAEFRAALNALKATIALDKLEMIEQRSWFEPGSDDQELFCIGYLCRPAKHRLTVDEVSLSGVVDVYAAWRADGQGTIVAVYNSKADADAAATKIQALWGTLAGLLRGAPNIDTYDDVEHVVG
jgi:hypothetical protein